MHKAVETFLAACGANCDPTGASYLRELIVMFHTQPTRKVTDMYREVAANHRLCWHTPEKKIRRLISRTHASGTLFKLNDLFGMDVIDTYLPTVKNILALMSAYILITAEAAAARSA